jgi:hypothetical protein
MCFYLNQECRFGIRRNRQRPTCVGGNPEKCSIQELTCGRTELARCDGRFDCAF